MISSVITVIEWEDREETLQGCSYVLELWNCSMSSAVSGLIGWECPLGQLHQLPHSHVQAVLGSIHPLQLLKVFPSITDIDESGCRCWGGKKCRNEFLFWFGFLNAYSLQRNIISATYEWRGPTWWPWHMCWRWRRQWRPQSWSSSLPCFGKRPQVYYKKKE